MFYGNVFKKCSLSKSFFNFDFRKQLNLNVIRIQLYCISGMYISIKIMVVLLELLLDLNSTIWSPENSVKSQPTRLLYNTNTRDVCTIISHETSVQY